MNANGIQIEYIPTSIGSPVRAFFPTRGMAEAFIRGNGYEALKWRTAFKPGDVNDLLVQNVVQPIGDWQAWKE